MKQRRSPVYDIAWNGTLEHDRRVRSLLGVEPQATRQPTAGDSRQRAGNNTLYVIDPADFEDQPGRAGPA